MKKILSLLLTFVLLVSFGTLCNAAPSGKYQIVFTTKQSYDGTKYENVFSDHRNFRNVSSYGIDGIIEAEIVGAFCSINPHLDPPYYIICVSTDARTRIEADIIALEMIARGITYSPKVTDNAGYSFFEKEYFGADFMIPENRLTRFSGDNFGDIDCTGEVTALDARTALRISVGLEKKENYPYVLGDMDYDGKITASDAREILRVSVGLSGYATTD